MRGKFANHIATVAASWSSSKGRVNCKFENDLWFIILIFYFGKEEEEEEEDAGSWCSDQQDGEFEAFSGEEDEGIEPKSLDTHSETEDEAAGSTAPEVAPPVSTLERKSGERRVEFRLPSRESSAEKEEGSGQLTRIFAEGGLLEELR